jgi:uncharacterized membrane protein YbaN (DUF454 family)
MKKLMLMIAGWLSLVLGLIGVILPLLPTTPFVLLSAYCFSRSSTRLHRWLTSHPWFGPPILQWQQTRTVNRHIKARALYLILITFTISLIVTPLPLIGKAALVLLALVLMGFVARLPEPTQTHSTTQLKVERAITPGKEEG